MIPNPSFAARIWLRFKAQRRAYWSLWLFLMLFGASLGSELLSNDKPLVLSYQGSWHFPLWQDYPETRFGGDFASPTDYLDPFISAQLAKPGNWVVFALNRYSADTINYFASSPNPAAPSSENYLGTDDRGRDVLARLLYSFRVSVLFGLALTLSASLFGIVIGGLQGYFGGWLDLLGQRMTEIWLSLPELYLLLIFASVFEPGLALLWIVMSVFGWMGLADYVRAEFLRTRHLEYVTAARAMGLSHWQIVWRHVLPNSMTPVLTFLPFRMSAAILALTSLDFLGLGVAGSYPTLGEMLAQGKANLDAWWLSLSAFVVLVGMLMLLILIGEGVRHAFDPRAR